MVDVFKYPHDLAPLLEWADMHSGDLVADEPPEPFATWVKGVLPDWCTSFKFAVGRVYVGSQLDGDWVDKYPHMHVDSMGWPANTATAILYLVSPEEGGESAIGGENKSDPYTLTKLTPGLTVLIGAKTWHGIKPVKAGTRIALLTTGWELEFV